MGTICQYLLALVATTAFLCLVTNDLCFPSVHDLSLFMFCVILFQGKIYVHLSSNNFQCQFQQYLTCVPPYLYLIQMKLEKNSSHVNHQCCKVREKRHHLLTRCKDLINISTKMVKIPQFITVIFINV